MKNPSKKIRNLAEKIIVVKTDQDIPFSEGSLFYKIAKAKLQFVGFWDVEINGVKTLIISE